VVCLKRRRQAEPQNAVSAELVERQRCKHHAYHNGAARHSSPSRTRASMLGPNASHVYDPRTQKGEINGLHAARCLNWTYILFLTQRHPYEPRSCARYLYSHHSRDNERVWQERKCAANFPRRRASDARRRPRPRRRPGGAHCPARRRIGRGHSVRLVTPGDIHGPRARSELSGGGEVAPFTSFATAHIVRMAARRISRRQIK
jgi:hypothetical protein